MAANLLLYDGVCGLCNRLVQFVIFRDRQQRFRFAPLQGELAAGILRRYGRDPADLDTVCVVANHGQPDERLLVRGRAVAFTLEELGGFWRVAVIARALPTFLIDAAYRLVARYRYRIFGKYDSCRLPAPGERQRFLGGPGEDPGGGVPADRG